MAHGLDHDPGAFECPCDASEYDCQQRAPVRTPCDCKHLVCRKCAAVAASVPCPAPCGLCGASAVGPFEVGDLVRDDGVLLALVDRLGNLEGQRCVSQAPIGCARPLPALSVYFLRKRGGKRKVSAQTLLACATVFPQALVCGLPSRR